MMDNCFRFAPRDSVPGLIAKICKYLKDHPGWSEEELEEQIKQFMRQTGVESFNGRTGAVMLNEDDINSLNIASAYFAEGSETINDLNLKELYNKGVRFVFTNWNTATSGYDLAFVLEYLSGSDSVVYYHMAAGSSGGGNVISVNGKTGIVEISLSDILGDSGAQVKLCTATEFAANTLETWNAYYDDGYRIVGIVNSDASAIDYIYILKQEEDNHQPIGLSTGASDAYTPTNPPPYPVTQVNGGKGEIWVSRLYESTGNPSFYVTTGTNPYFGLFRDDGTLNKGIGLYEDKAEINVYGNSGEWARSYLIYSELTPPPYPVTSVNDKTGAVTGLYDAENPPPYPVTSVNGKTGAVTGLYNAENPPPYPVTSVNGKTGAITGVYDTENPPPSRGIEYKGILYGSISGGGTSRVTIDFSGLSNYIGGSGFVIFKYYVTSNQSMSFKFIINGAGVVHTAIRGSTDPFPVAAESTFTVPLSIIGGTSITVENASISCGNIYADNCYAYVYN